MAKFKKVHAPAGTDQVNVGTDQFRVDNDGDVEVPEEAVGPLLAVGGFTVDEERDADPTGFVRLKHHDGASACSWGGSTYEAREDGSFAVPALAASDLLAHGFVGDETLEVSVDPEPETANPVPVPKLKIPTK